MATAARETSDNGRNDRRLAKRPSPRPSTVVAKPVTTKVSPITRRVWPRSASENTSKYVALTEGMGTPTTICGWWPWIVEMYVWVAALPAKTSRLSWAGSDDSLMEWEGG